MDSLSDSFPLSLPHDHTPSLSSSLSDSIALRVSEVSVRYCIDQMTSFSLQRDQIKTGTTRLIREMSEEYINRMTRYLKRERELIQQKEQREDQEGREEERNQERNREEKREEWRESMEREGSDENQSESEREREWEKKERKRGHDLEIIEAKITAFLPFLFHHKPTEFLESMIIQYELEEFLTIEQTLSSIERFQAIRVESSCPLTQLSIFYRFLVENQYGLTNIDFFCLLIAKILLDTKFCPFLISNEILQYLTNNQFHTVNRPEVIEIVTMLSHSISTKWKHFYEFCDGIDSTSRGVALNPSILPSESPSKNILLNQFREEVCGICLHRDTCNPEMTILCCGSIYHFDCILQWFTTQSKASRNLLTEDHKSLYSCPTCRSSVMLSSNLSPPTTRHSFRTNPFQALPPPLLSSQQHLLAAPSSLIFRSSEFFQSQSSESESTVLLDSSETESGDEERSLESSPTNWGSFDSHDDPRDEEDQEEEKEFQSELNRVWITGFDEREEGIVLQNSNRSFEFEDMVSIMNNEELITRIQRRGTGPRMAYFEFEEVDPESTAVAEDLRGNVAPLEPYSPGPEEESFRMNLNQTSQFGSLISSPHSNLMAASQTQELSLPPPMSWCDSTSRVENLRRIGAYYSSYVQLSPPDLPDLLELVGGRGNHEVYPPVYENPSMRSSQSEVSSNSLEIEDIE